MPRACAACTYRTSCDHCTRNENGPGLRPVLTPSRLDPPGLAGRLISAGLPAAVLARSAHRTSIPAVLTASAAALAAARVCHDARAALARRVPDPAVGVVEDVLAIVLAAVGSG